MSKNTDLGLLVNYIKGQVTGRLNAPAYTSATAFTGTIAGYLGFDTSGNILTSAGVGFTGSGTTNYVPKFTGSTALGNSNIQDSGTALTFGVASTFSSTGLFQGATLTVGSAVALTDVKLILNGVSSQAASIEFRQSGVSQWFLGNGAASNDNNFELYNSNGTMAMKIIKATNAINFIGTFGVTGAATFTSSVTAGDIFSTDGTRTNFFGVSTGANIGYIGMTTNHNLAFLTNNTEKMRLDSSGRLGLGTTSTSGYAMTVTGVDGTNYSPSSIYKIITRFVNNTSENRGIGIGYHTNADVNYACIYTLSQASAAFPQTGIAFGVYNYSTSAYVIRFTISETTVKITNIPTSNAGLGTGDLWNDGGTVKIV